ncbi:hypothetical protein D3C73_1053080 [compost metagenome]
MARHLDTNAVPFPFSGIVCRIELFEVAVVHRIGEHDGMEDRRGGKNRLVRPSLQPGEQAFVRRRQAMPEGFDVDHIFPAHIRQRLFGETRGHADAQRPGGKLQEGEAAGCIELVEKIAHGTANFGAAERVHAFDDLGQAGFFGDMLLCATIPDKRDGFGQIANIVVGIAEQDLVHPLHDQLTQHGGLDAFEIQRACKGCKTVTAIGVWGGAEIIDEQRELAVAGRG